MILCIYGSGGLGREVYDVALRRNQTSNSWKKIIFIDDFEPEGEFFGTSRIKLASLDAGAGNYEGLVAVGEPSFREKLFNKLTKKRISMLS